MCFYKVNIYWSRMFVYLLIYNDKIELGELDVM